MIIEVGEALHTYIAVCMIVSVSFLVGMQFGHVSTKGQKEND